MKKKSLANPAVKKKSGILFVCSTPIGNLADITFRVVDTLKAVNFIIAEDTRTTQKLLNHYQIKKEILSYHDFNKNIAAEKIVSKLEKGEQAALVSDAGTPGISDPGYYLINQALQKNIKVAPLPGASAITTALSISGLPTDKFTFAGFPPRKEQELKKYLTSLKKEKKTLIFYEAPHRLLQTLDIMHNIFGNRQICIARELTKLYEDILRDTLENIIKHFKNIRPQGEFTIIIAGNNNEISNNIEDLKSLMLNLAKAGISKKDISKILSAHFKLSKNKIYEQLLAWEQ